MRIIEFFKKLLSPSSTNRVDERRDDLELANMPVKTEELEMNINMPSNSTMIEDENPITAKVQTPQVEENLKVTDLVEDEEVSGLPTECKTKEVAVDDAPKGENTLDNAPNSLLDNTNYMSMADSLASLMEEIEDMGDLPSTELMEIVKSRLQEGFLISGAELISEDKEFDAIRHVPVPAAMVKRGAPIERTIEPGIIIDGKVIRKAKVEIKKQ